MPTFGKCVESYIENKIKSSEAVKITQLKKEIEALKKEVRGWKITLEDKKYESI